MSKNALIAMILKKNSEKYRTEKELERKLANMYNADLKSNVEKYRDYYNIEFGIEIINKKFIGEDVLIDAIDLLNDIINNTISIEGSFPDGIVEREKTNLINKIREQKDQKKSYALLRIEELLFSKEDYGYPVLGKEEDVENINSKDLYEYYLKIIDLAKVVVILNGNLEGYEDIEEILNSKLRYKENLKSCKTDNEGIAALGTEIVVERQDVSQSILSFGLKFNGLKEADVFKAAVLNAILGGTPSSKMFQNIREKESLAYYAKSIYNRQKGAIYVIAGIEPANYPKAKELIEKEINFLINGNISGEELKTAKEYIISKYKEMQDDKSAMIKFALSNEIMFNKQIAIDEIISSLEQIEKIDLDPLAKKISIQKVYLLGGRENG